MDIQLDRDESTERDSVWSGEHLSHSSRDEYEPELLLTGKRNTSTESFLQLVATQCRRNTNADQLPIRGNAVVDKHLGKAIASSRANQG